MKLILNNITDRPSSYNQLQDAQSSNIVRLVEDSEIKKTIRFDEMSIDNGPDPTTEQGGNKKMDELGLVYPMIRINDIILSRSNIRSMTLSMNGFMPTISLNLMFNNVNFISKNMPKDGDIISIFIRVDTAALTYLRDDFIITNCNGFNATRGEMDSNISLSGRLFIEAFDSRTSIDAFAGSSKFVMKELAKKFGLGFAYNDFDDTDDFMNWIQCRETTQTFIENVIRHAWKNETSFFKAWIDLYYNICFVNVNKFLLSTENEEEVDITFATNIMNMYNQLADDTSVGSARMSVKVLTTMTEFKNTPFFIRRWNPINKSSAISMSTGYSTSSFTFKHNQNIINSGDYNCFEELTNIPAYDQNKIDSFILLRGRAKYEAGKNPDNEQARVNHEYIGTYNRAEWTGVEYVMSDNDNTKNPNEWSGNVHKNYNRAPYHNTQNINELNKMYLEVICEGLNLQIMKGERIPVIIGFTNSFENDMYNNATGNDEPRQINKFYSGYYIVDSVEYVYNPMSNEGVSPYTTKYVLKRREWPAPEAIAKDKETK